MGLHFSKGHFGGPIFEGRGVLLWFSNNFRGNRSFWGEFIKGVHIVHIRQFLNLFLLHLNVHLVFLGNKKCTLNYHGLIFFRMGEGYFGGKSKIKNYMVLKIHWGGGIFREFTVCDRQCKQLNTFSSLNLSIIFLWIEHSHFKESHSQQYFPTPFNNSTKKLYKHWLMLELYLE